MSEEAAQFIAANKDQPFFLNYWAFGVHSPWMGKNEYIEEAAKRFDPKAGQRNPVYAAMVRSLDDSVGRIVAELEKHKLLDNTIIIFTNDNGGWHNVAKEATNNKAYMDVPVTSNAPFRSGKASNYEGGTHVPLLVVWPGNTKPGSIRDIPAGAGPYTVELKMKSNSKDDGQVCWATADEKAFHKTRSVSFSPPHDGEWHTHELKLPAEKPLTALHDPSTAADEIRVETFIIKDNDGKLLKTWDAPKVRK